MHEVVYFWSRCLKHCLIVLLFLEGVEYIDVVL